MANPQPSKKRKPGRPLKQFGGGKLIGTYVPLDKLHEMKAICIREGISRTQFINSAIVSEIKAWNEK